MIISGGQNVLAAEVEEAILGCPGVVECAVIGLPDDLWGERVSGRCGRCRGRAVDREAVIRECRSAWQASRRPRK